MNHNLNTNNENFWDAAKEVVIRSNRLPVNNPEQFPGFYADITEQVVNYLQHSENPIKDLQKMQADLLTTSVPLDEVYRTAFKRWEMYQTPDNIIVFTGYDLLGEFTTHFACSRRNCINNLKKIVKCFAEQQDFKFQFCWFSSDLLGLNFNDFLKDELYFSGGSCAAPDLEQSSSEVVEPLVPVSLNVNKKRQMFGKEMQGIYGCFTNSMVAQPVVHKKGVKDYVLFNGRLYKKNKFENKCERAGRYYVLYDGSETLLFSFVKVTTLFQITSSMKRLLENANILRTDDNKLIDIKWTDNKGNECELYIPYIYISHSGSYKKQPSALPSALTRFRLWQMVKDADFDMNALYDFVFKFWRYPSDSLHTFCSLGEFCSKYVGEAIGGNYGERLAMPTDVNTSKHYDTKYNPWEDQTFDKDIAEHIASIITSVPIGKDVNGKTAFHQQHLYRLKSGEFFICGLSAPNRYGLCIPYTSYPDSLLLRMWVRKHLEETVYTYIFGEDTPKPCYEDTATEIAHCIYPSVNDMWSMISTFRRQNMLLDDTGTPVENETLYQDNKTGRYFIYGIGYDRPEYYSMTDLGTKCREATEIPLDEVSAARWVKKHFDPNKMREIFGDIDLNDELTLRIEYDEK